MNITSVLKTVVKDNLKCNTSKIFRNRYNFDLRHWLFCWYWWNYWPSLSCLLRIYVQLNMYWWIPISSIQSVCKIYYKSNVDIGVLSFQILWYTKGSSTRNQELFWNIWKVGSQCIEGTSNFRGLYFYQISCWKVVFTSEVLKICRSHIGGICYKFIQ